MSECVRAPATMPQGLVEFAARADLELGEHLAHVPLHRPSADEQLCTDLGVGSSFASQLSDFRLLRGQFRMRVLVALADLLTCRLELPPRALAEGLDAHGPERLV